MLRTASLKPFKAAGQTQPLVVILVPSNNLSTFATLNAYRNTFVFQQMSSFYAPLPLLASVDTLEVLLGAAFLPSKPGTWHITPSGREVHAFATS
jgi:hypothetical protein